MHAHTRTHTRTHARTHARTHTHKHALTHAHRHSRTHIRTHARTHAHTHTHTHTHMLTHTHAHTHTHKHTHTYTHTYTHTCISTHKAHTSCHFTAQKASPTFQQRCFPLLVYSCNVCVLQYLKQREHIFCVSLLSSIPAIRVSCSIFNKESTSSVFLFFFPFLLYVCPAVS